jgi:UDP-N-acetylglucosamine--N-acetylmuramyl-(pentapeptide) pyrophosphoryl-undecaprenol N-acetylglucosamine transferase
VSAVPGSTSGGRGVLILAGGTGGHVYPALAVAERLAARGERVDWLGTAAGLEARVVPGQGFPLHTVPVTGLRGKGVRAWLAAPLGLARAVAAARRVVLKVRPAVVLGMGGFVSGPGGVAAWIQGRPLVVHEQNAVPGLTNRLLSRLARVVLEAFPGSFPPARRARHTGNPVRAPLAGLPPPAERLAGRAGPLRLLVLGGSQGARVLNETVPAALAALPAPGLVTVWHQAGPAQIEGARAAYARAGVGGRVDPYIEDMAEAYAWADLALCRAGAMTLAELAAAGLGAVLVPFPFAVDDHQTHNARYLSERGAALLLPQSELTPARLAETLAGLAAARGRLLAMAEAARALARPDAAEAVARACLEAADG